VRIEHAYVRGAPRAFVHRSHSGRYGEVNSEEGYQNLCRFLFGRWGVTVSLDGLPRHPAGADRRDEELPSTWQADMRLTIRGLPIVLSEQLAAHWCPIQIDDELARHVDTPDSPVPLAATFLLDPQHEAELARERGDAMEEPGHGGRLRYVLTLRVFRLVERGSFFRFEEHLEQVPDWADTLIVDVGSDGTSTDPMAWPAWNSEVAGPTTPSTPSRTACRPSAESPSPSRTAGAAC
jgi:hypothetical protein